MSFRNFGDVSVGLCHEKVCLTLFVKVHACEIQVFFFSLPGIFIQEIESVLEKLSFSKDNAKDSFNV